MKTGLLLPPFDLVEKWMYWSELWNELVSCGAKKEYKVLKHCSLHDSRTIGRGETLATKSAISCWTNPGPQKPAFPNTCQGLNVYCGSQANYSVVFVTQSGGSSTDPYTPSALFISPGPNWQNFWIYFDKQNYWYSASVPSIKYWVPQFDQNLDLQSSPCQKVSSGQ